MSRFDGEAFSQLRHDIGTVIADVNAYRDILIAPVRRGGKPFMAIRTLLDVPPWYGIETSTVSVELPHWTQTASSIKITDLGSNSSKYGARP